MPTSRYDRSAFLVNSQRRPVGSAALELVPIVDDLPGEMLPIIEPGAAKVVVVDAKAERPHQPQLGPDRHARAADAARVVGNLRLVQDDVQQRFVSSAGDCAERFDADL